MKKQTDLREILALYEQFSPGAKARDALTQEQVLAAAQAREFLAQQQPHAVQRMRLENDAMSGLNPLKVQQAAQELAQLRQSLEQDKQSFPVKLQGLGYEAEARRLQNQFEQSTMDPRVEAAQLLPRQAQQQISSGVLQDALRAKEIAAFDEDAAAMKDYKKSQALQSLVQAAALAQSQMPGEPSRVMGDAARLGKAVGIPLNMPEAPVQVSPGVINMLQQKLDLFHKLSPQDLEMLKTIPVEQLPPELLQALRGAGNPTFNGGTFQMDHAGSRARGLVPGLSTLLNH